ncbi:butyrophilin subfamily 1 member A1-like [Salminus brasiliensis]|uniref:butyrophilin subfamily 1 member A1-like n=1 Tax=Salminus brasiliensis TaxID=930266 RepID=UPI003B834E9B
MSLSSCLLEAMLMRWTWLAVSLSLCDGNGLFSVVVPQAPVYSLLGSSVSLPCSLSPALNAQGFEVLWYRPQESHTPVLFYKDQKIQENPRDPRYQGRVSLFGGLEQGNVSLKLENFSVADTGEYICRVEKTEEWFDEARVSLQVKVIGSVPVLSVVDAGGGQVNLSCHSPGWKPEPSLSWRDREGRNLKHPSKDTFFKDSEGLVNASSWLLVSPSDSQWFSCSVGFSDFSPERKESQMLLHTSTGVERWKNAFIVILILFILSLLCNIGVYFVLHRTGTLKDVENQQLLELQAAENQANQPAALANHTEYVAVPPHTAVNITLDLKETPQFFRITHGGKRVHCPRPKEDDEDKESKIFTLCKEKFSSGQQCWEVKVCQKAKEKLSWFVGVAREEAENVHRIPLTPQNGFWVLCYEKEKGVYVRDSPEPTPLPDVSDKLTAVGVFLDCEEQTLSFYSVPTKSLIYTFTSVTSRTSLRPLISPGIRDSQPVQI